MVVIGLGFKVKERKAGSRTLAKEDRGLQPYPNLRPWLKWVNGDNKDLHQQFRVIIFAIIKFINLEYGVMSTEENKTEMVYQVKVNVYCGYQVEDYMPNKPVLKFEDEVDLDIQDKLDEMGNGCTVYTINDAGMSLNIYDTDYGFWVTLVYNLD